MYLNFILDSFDFAQRYNKICGCANFLVESLEFKV